MARYRLEYGRRHGQHGDLWLPDSVRGRSCPVVVLLHGGFWKAIYTKSLMTNLAVDLIDRGWAAWNLEYRRVGSFPPGGWPGTFEDVGAGIDYLGAIAGSYNIDLSRVVAVGHSAGGHLALWAAARAKLPPGAPGAQAGAPAPDSPASGSFREPGVPALPSGLLAPPPGVPAVQDRPGGAGGRSRLFVPLQAAIGLAPVADLGEAARQGLGGGAVPRLLGGPPQRHLHRYALADPAALLPIGVPQVLVHGDRDGVVPISLSRRYVERAVEAGDEATLVELPGIGHMELIDPASMAWPPTVFHLRRFLA